MNALEELHKRIDESDWDVKEIDTFNKAFLNANQILTLLGERELLQKSEREREVFNFQKSPEKGLHWKLQGVNTFKDGRQGPFDWPDIKTWQDEDFKYIHDRFLTCKNKYARTEYGLLLFYKNKLSLEECRRLFEELFTLSKRYYETGKSNEKNIYRVWDFYNTLSNAAHIAYYKREASVFLELLSEALHFAEIVHKGWKETGKYMLRTTIDMTGLILLYFEESRKIVDIDGFIDRNNQALEEQNKSYTWGAIYIIDENIKLCKKYGKEFTHLIRRKAELYEKLYAEARETRLMAAISFLEIALKLYKEIGHIDKVNELGVLYQKIRHDARLGNIRHDLPDEYNQKMLELIKQQVEKNDEQGIVMLLCIAGMFDSLEHINKINSESNAQQMLIGMASSFIIDKYGNTIDAFITPEERDEFQFWQTYTFQFQIGVQNLQAFFIEAYKAGKVTYKGVSQFILNSWIGKMEVRNYNGVERDFRLSDTILPAIKEFFRQLDDWRATNEPPLFVTIIDSLSLKIEKILREFCKMAGIIIFKEVRKKGTFEIKNEKNIDDLLRELKSANTGFSEDDRMFIQYVLTEKAGQNLRHKVAHGLLDIDEYPLHYALLCIVIILKLSAYKILPDEHRS
jgi:hypothetical protein